MKFNIQPELKKYYVSIGLLGVLVITVALINLIGGSSLRHDYRLEVKIRDIQGAVESYAYSQTKLPELLPDAGIKESGGVEYKKVSDSRFMLCATFKTKSDGYYAPDPGYLSELQTESLKSGVALDVNTHYTNGEKEGMKHEKGYSCIVYQPYQLSEEYVYPYRLCNKEKFKMYPIYNQTLGSVDAATKRFTTGRGGNLTIQTSPAVGLPTALTYTLSPEAKIYNSQCEEVAFDMLKAGDTVEIYQQSAGNTVDGIKITYSASPPPPVTPRTTPNNNLQ